MIPLAGGENSLRLYGNFHSIFMHVIEGRSFAFGDEHRALHLVNLRFVQMLLYYTNNILNY